MRLPPFRLLIFLAALLAFSVHAAAIDLPYEFRPDDVIRAEQVNANFATIATAVAAKAWPIEIVRTDGRGTTTFEMEKRFPFVDETITTRTAGRWFIQKSVRLALYCDGPTDTANYYLAIDGVPIPSTRAFGLQADDLQTTLSGATDDVVPAGEHVIDVYGDCPNSNQTGTATYTGTVSTVLVIPE